MNIYVSNIAYNATDEMLRDAFAVYGAVQSSRVIKDRATGRSRGFGFVEMANDEEAKVALESVNGVEMLGRKINAREARPREEGKEGGGRPQGNGDRGHAVARQREPQPQVINRGVY